MSTRLLISKKSFKTKVLHFIDEADDFRGFNQLSEDHLKEARELFRWWKNRVATYLSQAFSDDSISKKFKSEAGGWLMRSTSLNDRCEELVNDIDERISRLRMVIESEDIKAEIETPGSKDKKWNVPLKYAIPLLVAVIGAGAMIIAAMISTFNSSAVNVYIDNNQNLKESSGSGKNTQ